MGRTVVNATVIGATESREYEFLVDTGATYMGLPQNEIDELGLQPVVNGIFEVMTATGVTDIQAYGITGMIDGRGFVTMAMPSPIPLIGYELLEHLRYRVNPVTRRLERVPRGETAPPYMLLGNASHMNRFLHPANYQNRGASLQ